MHSGAIHLFDRSAMDRKQIQRVPRKYRQQFFKDFGRVETDSRFHRKPDFDRIPQRGEDRINAFRLPKQTPSSAFFVNHRRGTSQIKINGGDWVLLQLARRANQSRDVVADHLGDDRAASGVFSDRTQDTAIEIGSRMDSEIFREIQIGSAIRGHQSQKRQIGDVLHWRQRQNRR